MIYIFGPKWTDPNNWIVSDDKDESPKQCYSDDTILTDVLLAATEIRMTQWDNSIKLRITGSVGYKVINDSEMHVDGSFCELEINYDEGTFVAIIDGSLTPNSHLFRCRISLE